MSSLRNFRGTIVSRSGFDPLVAASMLEKAMKGSGCDQKEIARVITGMNNAQRQISRVALGPTEMEPNLIIQGGMLWIDKSIHRTSSLPSFFLVREQYRTTYGKDLVEELKKELSGDVEYVILALMEPPLKFDAIHLHRAIKGIGTTESVLVDVLCTRSSPEIETIKNEYLLSFDKSLETDVIGETSSDFQQLLVALLQCRRDQGDGVDVNAAREDAKRMLGNKEEKLKPDKEAFKVAFATQNYQQLEALFDEYQLLSGKSIQNGIEKVFSGNAKTAYLAIVDSIQDTPKFFARRLYESMKGLGTDDLDLIGIVVSRSEIDLAEIRSRFEQKYHKPLVDFIRSDCSGEYCETLNDEKYAAETTMLAHPKLGGTIKRQTDFCAKRTANALEKAMRSWSCDKRTIYEEITRINNDQRQMVCGSYKTIYGKDLIDELRKALWGDFENVIVGLMETPIKYDVTQLYRAMKGLGTRESTLIDIICSRTDAEKMTLKRAYQEEFGRSLEEDVIGDTSGHFQRLLVSLLQCHRDIGDKVNGDTATQDALLLMGNEQDNVKPDIATFSCTFASQNFAQLHKLFEQYQLFTSETIQDCIQKTFTGDARAAYLAVADCVENKPRYFARRLYESMKGLGTSDCDLIYIIVSRSEIDLADIRNEFDAMYDNTLVEWIKSDCSAAYRDTLLSLINGNS
ncbi:Annexin A6 [Toxocara canis]|uniref:Annexin n=1 Tax=Toxocara canis TaxID=6265 RepID=A0A0B2VUL1_TOXCA|nr:Annexin A6 [Toxocara canis]